MDFGENRRPKPPAKKPTDRSRLRPKPHKIHLFVSWRVGEPVALVAAAWRAVRSHVRVDAGCLCAGRAVCGRHARRVSQRRGAAPPAALGRRAHRRVERQVQCRRARGEQDSVERDSIARSRCGSSLLDHLK